MDGGWERREEEDEEGEGEEEEEEDGREGNGARPKEGNQPLSFRPVVVAGHDGSKGRNINSRTREPASINEQT